MATGDELDKLVDEEKHLVLRAKVTLMKRILAGAEANLSATQLLNLAETYAVIHQKKASGRINAPVTD
ncbi:hypothetical protein GCM10010435_21710 [Winogradskya consettensis]|uniref:Uncharacterized protein n=2 Tax=Winogradskya TaxID=3240235 RepID=A0A919S7Y4_9ACTN|nr:MULTISPECIES: hypothetical protein [Actinoplanes]GIE26283.1 hypothetical protein Ahu01nite_093850 [Actinoplanes humidus]GIM66686.1 hypothetical protein Aco04nite_03000 [Actinoplanes consettensis]